MPVLCLLAVAAMLTGMLLQQTVMQYRIAHNYIKSWQILDQLENDLNYLLNGDNLRSSIVTHLTGKLILEESIDHSCSTERHMTILTLTHKIYSHYILYVELEQQWSSYSNQKSKPRVTAWNFSQT